MNPRMTVRGKVERFGDSQLNIVVENVEELRSFYREHAPHRNLDWMETAEPRFTVSKRRFVARCRAGDDVAYLFELRLCKDGPRASGLNLQVLSTA